MLAPKLSTNQRNVLEKVVVSKSQAVEIHRAESNFRRSIFGHRLKSVKFGLTPLTNPRTVSVAWAQRSIVDYVTAHLIYLQGHVFLFGAIQFICERPKLPVLLQTSDMSFFSGLGCCWPPRYELTDRQRRRYRGAATVLADREHHAPPRSLTDLPLTTRPSAIQQPILSIKFADFQT